MTTTGTATSPDDTDTARSTSRIASFIPSGPRSDPSSPSEPLPNSTASSSPDSDKQPHCARDFSTSALSSLKLPGPGYELESLPATPTLLQYMPSPSPFDATSTSAGSSPFPRYPPREVTATPAISSDPTQAFKTSMSQAGGFYMTTEDQTRAQRLSDLLTRTNEGQFRPQTAFGHAREFTRDSEQDYFSASSLSASSGSSLAFQWKQDPTLSPHYKEDSGYGFPNSSIGSQALDESTDRCASRGSAKNRLRPSLRLDDNAVLRGSGASFDRSLLSHSSDAHFEETRLHNTRNAFAVHPQISGSMTPRMSDFWQAGINAFPQTLHDARDLSQNQTPSGRHLPGETARRMPTFPGDDPYYGGTQGHDKALRHSYSVRFVHHSISCREYV